MHIVIGYDSPKGYANPQMLYCGEDRGEALGFTQTAPAGIARVEVFSHPRPAQRKFFTEVIAPPKKVAKKAAKKVEAKVDAKDEADES